MSKAALSMFIFGIYVILFGIILMVVPNALLAIFGLPATTEVWVRVVGMLVFLIGYLYPGISQRKGNDQLLSMDCSCSFISNCFLHYFCGIWICKANSHFIRCY